MKALWIDDRIKIVVVEIRGDKVRLGVEAPRKFPSIAKKFTKPLKVAANKQIQRQNSTVTNSRTTLV